MTKRKSAVHRIVWKVTTPDWGKSIAAWPGLLTAAQAGEHHAEDHDVSRRKHRHPDSLLDAADAAARLSITTEQLLRFVKSGDLRSINMGKGREKPRYRFKPADLDDFISARSTSEP